MKDKEILKSQNIFLRTAEKNTVEKFCWKNGFRLNSIVLLQNIAEHIVVIIQMANRQRYYFLLAHFLLLYFHVC